LGSPKHRPIRVRPSQGVLHAKTPPPSEGSVLWPSHGQKHPSQGRRGAGLSRRGWPNALFGFAGPHLWPKGAVPPTLSFGHRGQRGRIWPCRRSPASPLLAIGCRDGQRRVVKERIAPARRGLQGSLQGRREAVRGH
jgi:hypothetical protein